MTDGHTVRQPDFATHAGANRRSAGLRFGAACLRQLVARGHRPATADPREMSRAQLRDIFGDDPHAFRLANEQRRLTEDIARRARFPL